MVKAHIAIQTAKTTPGLIDEIIARHPIELVRDDDVTWQLLATKTHWTRWQCEKAIREDVENGYLVKVVAWDENGHKRRVYRKPVDIVPQK